MAKKPQIPEDPILKEMFSIRQEIHMLDKTVIEMMKLLDNLLSQQDALDRAAGMARAQHVANIREFMSGRWHRRSGTGYPKMLAPKKGAANADSETGDL